MIKKSFFNGIRGSVLTAGVLVLGTLGVLAHKVSSPATSLAYSTGLNCHVLLSSGAPSGFTTTTQSHQAKLVTKGGGSVNMWTANCGKAVYFTAL